MSRLGASIVRYRGVLLGLPALGAVYLTSFHSYLLFHSLAEMFSIVVAASVFVLAWNTRKLYENGYLLFVGTAYGFVGGIDLLHTLAYKGMGVFHGYAESNLATQLWIAARGYEAFCLLVAPALVRRKPAAGVVVAGHSLVTGLLLCAILWWRIFPVCYVDEPGAGLTPFKINAEYVIAGALATALGLLWMQRRAFAPRVLYHLSGAIVVTICAEIAFTQYISVYGWPNLLGHLLKIISFYLIYRAIVETGLTQPYSLLFRELKEREEALLASERVRTQMMQFLAHDLRSPLGGILAGMGVLRRELGDRLERKYGDVLEGAEASSQWMLELINTLLDSARLETGALHLKMDEVPVRDLLDSAVEKVALSARLTGVRVDLTVEDEVSTVAADREVTLRVLLNLLSNAVRHSPSASVVSVQATQTGDGSVEFQVSDQGAGMPAEWADAVLRPSRRTPPVHSGGPGTGLGLYFCRLAVEAQGGHISLQSTEGRGTTVTFTLPSGNGHPHGGLGPLSAL